MCNYDYDEPSFYSETERKAKIKQHRCDECFRTINIGELYIYHFGVWDGIAGKYKTCSHCRIAQNWLLKECNGFIHSQLLDEITDHAIDYKKIYIYRFAVGIKRQWRKFYSSGLMNLPKITQDVITKML
jgi:hypothetical protein